MTFGGTFLMPRIHLLCDVSPSARGYALAHETSNQQWKVAIDHGKQTR
jgi:hypothetical protein